MSARAHLFSIKPDFLDSRKYHAVTWSDTPDSDQYPRKVKRQEILVDNQTNLEFSVGTNGGFTAILKPAGN
jgi:hypothetical protein